MSVDAGTGTAPGVFTGSYDESGNLITQTYPNGLVASWRYDDTDSPVALSYSMGGVEWLSFAQAGGVDGHTIGMTGPLSSQVFGYDYAGRLIQTQDTVSDGAGGATCTTRSYTFDKDSNRTGYASYPDDGSDPSNPVCTTTTTATSTVTSTFDEADRLTATGYVYDTLGRTTTVPGVDAVGTGAHAGLSGDLAVGYYANDIVASQTQGGVTRSYGLDPAQNRIATATEGSTVTVNHYDGDADSPSWTETTTAGATTTSRAIAGIGGDLAATQDQTGTVVLQLANLHGDVVATVDDSLTATGTSSYAESTEFGIARDPATAYNDYGWLGAKQRSADALGGIVLMGIRLYNPATGRFLQTDPVAGGNPNAYTYPCNPINSTDLTGQWGIKKWFKKHIKAIHKILNIVVPVLAGIAAGAACGFSAGVGCLIMTGAMMGWLSNGAANYAAARVAGEKVSNRQLTRWGIHGAVSGAVNAIRSGVGAGGLSLLWKARKMGIKRTYDSVRTGIAYRFSRW